MAPRTRAVCNRPATGRNRLGYVVMRHRMRAALAVVTVVGCTRAAVSLPTPPEPGMGGSTERPPTSEPSDTGTGGTPASEPSDAAMLSDAADANANADADAEAAAPPPNGTPGCVSNPSPVFTAHVVSPASLRYIDPPGRPLGGDIKPHAYLYGDRPLPSLGFPVYAPSNGRVVSMSYYYQYEPQSARNIDQYILNFEASCEVSVVLDHLKTVVPKLASVQPAQTNSTMGTDLSPPVSFTAGELLGYVGGDFLGSPIQAFYALDLRLYNTSVTNGCESYAHWDATKHPGTTSSPYTHCAFSYFSPSLRADYLAKFGFEETLFPQQSCGSPCKNVLGKIAGKWFLDSGSDAEYGPTLAIDITLDGTTVTASSGTWMLSGAGPDPRASSGPACFSDSVRWLYFANVTATTADVATGLGACPASFPSSGYKTYAR